MNFINLIKKTVGVKDKWGVARKWIVYYDKEHNVKEIKSLFNPHEYNGKSTAAYPYHWTESTSLLAVFPPKKQTEQSAHQLPLPGERSKESSDR